MPSEMSPIDKAKYVAARRAVEYVEDGMRVGLGTGSTAVWMVRCLGEMVREEGMMITTVATSSPHGGAGALGRPRRAAAR
jgi:ribose 5-phosphate isomerase A